MQYPLLLSPLLITDAPDVITSKIRTVAVFLDILLARRAVNYLSMDALDAHTTMSSQALGSERIREGLKDILLGPAQLYESLRERAVPTRLG